MLRHSVRYSAGLNTKFKGKVPFFHIMMETSSTQQPTMKMTCISHILINLLVDNKIIDQLKTKRSALANLLNKKISSKHTYFLD